MLPAGAFIFVTDNYTDFSDPTHREKLHPELASEVPKGVKYCYHSLDGFRKKRIKDVEIKDEHPATTISAACQEPISAIAAPRPSQYGGWSYQLYCGNCQLHIDLAIRTTSESRPPAASLAKSGARPCCPAIRHRAPVVTANAEACGRTNPESSLRRPHQQQDQFDAIVIDKIYFGSGEIKHLLHPICQNAHSA